MHKAMLSGVVIAAGLLLLGLAAQPTQTANARGAVELKAPEFVANADPNSAESFIGDLLDQEAGISAYYKSPSAITLSQVRSTFRTIETETAEYIIGSVAVTGYEEHYDAHVYVNTNGWILAYYLRADPVSKIIDLLAQTINTTKLRTVVSTVAGAAGAPFTDVTYYDFRYPNATHMLLVAEDNDNGNSFTISVPSTYGYFERGWANYDNWYHNFWFDGVGMPNTVWNANSMSYGTLTASQVLPDVTHTFTVDTSDNEYGVLVLVYQVP
jgi:hypothetical protein